MSFWLVQNEKEIKFDSFNNNKKKKKKRILKNAAVNGQKNNTQ